jgi:NADPH:quinone reductase-like Zn-dependent oxidoreductase
MEGSGTVIEVGTGVTEFKPGDAVFDGHFNKSAVPVTVIGFCSEGYVLPQNRLIHKPDHLTFEGAAALFVSTLAAYQSFKVGAQLSTGSDDIDKLLRRKSVFISAALGGTGHAGLQLA